MVAASIKEEAAAAAASNIAPHVFIKHVQTIVRLRTALDEANSEYRTARKAAESDGVDLKALAMFEKLRKLDSSEAALRLKHLAQYASFMQLPWGTQLDMFGKTDDAPLSQEDAEKAETAKAEEEGYLRGAAGDARDTNPKSAGTPAHVGWDEGWARGHDFFVRGTEFAKETGAQPTTKPAGRRGKKGNPEDRQPSDGQAEA